MIRIVFYFALTLFCRMNADIPGLKDPKEIIPLQIQSLEHTIRATETTLSKIKELRAAIVDYEILQQKYLQDIKNKELLFRMTKTAYLLLKEIKASHLSHLFDVEFLSELNLLARIYRKNELPSG